ncbi:hypothetical protein, partial [Streptomyces tricolor]
VSPGWSPVARLGGYQASRPAGVRQAELLGEAVTESAQHHAWRVRRGLAPDAADAPFDPCFVL